MLDTIQADIATASPHVCSRCSKTEYLAGTRGGCAECRGIAPVKGKRACTICGGDMTGRPDSALHCSECVEARAAGRSRESHQRRRDAAKAERGENPVTENGRTAVRHCDHCGKECHGGQGKAAHERKCPKNPANGGGTAMRPESAPVVNFNATITEVPDGAIEPEDFNADEPVSERACPECPDVAERVADYAPGVTAAKIREALDEWKSEPSPRIVFEPLHVMTPFELGLDRGRTLGKRLKAPARWLRGFFAGVRQA